MKNLKIFSFFSNKKRYEMQKRERGKEETRRKKKRGGEGRKQMDRRNMEKILMKAPVFIFKNSSKFSLRARMTNEKSTS